MLLKLAMPIAGFGVVVAYGIALIIFAGHFRFAGASDDVSHSYDD